MVYLIFGLVLFLGLHSVRIFAEDWRAQRLAQMGEAAYKAVYSLLSLAGFGLIIWGFSLAREAPVLLWTPPLGMRHAASLLTLIAFILLVAAYVPRNGIRARLHHPMVLGVKTWALAHLLATGTVAHLVLFCAFLTWAVLDFIAARKRDRAANMSYPAGTVGATAVSVAVGVVAWAGFAFWGHGLLIGIRPFG
ncbi:MAG: NnrU family protein [Rhodoferax sp.]|nr:NnrU family protein [Rhodoferax sp.]MCF8211145.1 NnrU family protein [Rhodoferax sp.]